MTPGAQILLSGALSFGVPLALALRELLVLRRRGSGSWRPDGPRAPRSPSPLTWQPSLPPLSPSSHRPDPTRDEPSHATRVPEPA